MKQPSSSPTSPPEIRGGLRRKVLEGRNEHVQARGRYCTMMHWERDDLVFNMSDLFDQCERDVSALWRQGRGSARGRGWNRCFSR